VSALGNVPRARDRRSNERTRRRLNHAINRRNALVFELAPDLRCAECGDAFAVGDLHVDHVDGRTWSARSLSPQMRAARMWREHEAGVPLRALCRSCSAADGSRRRWRDLPRYREAR
jgi:hypothetical protein